MSLTYFFLLPPLSAFGPTSPFAAVDSGTEDGGAVGGSSSSPLLARDGAGVEEGDGDETEEDEEERLAAKELEEKEKLPSLTTREKIELARPLVKRFMLPLFFVYLAGASFSSFVPFPSLLLKKGKTDEADWDT